MAWVVPYVRQTWTDGSGGGTPVSAARLAVLEDGINVVSQAPAVRVTHNATQTLTTGLNGVLAFNTERYDQAGGSADTMHDTVTNNSRLTCRYAGVYSIKGMVEFAFNATGVRTVQIRLNGTTNIGTAREQAVTSGSNTTIVQVVSEYVLAVNDYVELLAFQDSGGNLNATVSGNYAPEFMMVRVG